MSFNIKWAEEKDLAGLKDFFTKVYRPDHIMAEKKYLDWQYKDAPANRHRPNFSNLLALNDEKIVGHLGLIPYEFDANGKKYQAAFLAGLVMDKELRGFGGGVFLAKEAEKYFDILYTTGFNREAAPIFRLCGWSKEKFLNRWVYLRGQKNAGTDAGMETVKKFDDGWDAVWRNLRSLYPLTIERTSGYLNWRFANNPFIKYKIFGFEGGYIVLRREDGVDYKSVRIVDFIAANGAEGPLLRAAIDFAEKEKVDFMDFFCSSSLYGGALMEFKFALYKPETNPEPPIFILPTDRKRLSVNYSYKFINQELKNTPENWFITKSDGDKDRAR